MLFNVSSFVLRIKFKLSVAIQCLTQAFLISVIFACFLSLSHTDYFTPVLIISFDLGFWNAIYIQKTLPQSSYCPQIFCGTTSLKSSCTFINVVRCCSNVLLQHSALTYHCTIYYLSPHCDINLRTKTVSFTVIYQRPHLLSTSTVCFMCVVELINTCI